MTRKVIHACREGNKHAWHDGAIFNFRKIESNEMLGSLALGLVCNAFCRDACHDGHGGGQFRDLGWTIADHHQ